MKGIFIHIIVTACILTTSCKKNETAKTSAAENIMGKWVLSQVYANDYWGGALYWQRAEADIAVNFTADKYYRKNGDDTNFVFIGTYKLLTDSIMQINGTNPIDSSVLVYTQPYFFDKDGSLNLGNNAFEGVVTEKFIR